MIHIFPDGAAQYDADVGEPPGNNLQVRVEDGFKIVSPRGQKFDLKKGTAIGILGTHLNELHPSFNGDDFVLSPDDPSTLANCQLEALDRWSGQHNSNGELPFNVELFTDIFQRIIPDGRRVLEMQEFQVEHCDPNRIASDRMEATILAQTEGYDINPALGPLPLKDGLDQSQIETARQKVLLYRMAEKRVQSLAHHLVRHRPNATVFIAHSDKDVNAHLTVKDPASKLYNYWHSDCFEPHELQPLNNNYLSSVGRAIPRIRIAPAHYITSENMDIPTGFNGEFIEDGAIYLFGLNELGNDGTMENLFVRLGMPVVISHELQADLLPHEEVKVVQSFYQEILHPLSNMVVEKLRGRPKKV